MQTEFEDGLVRTEKCFAQNIFFNLFWLKVFFEMEHTRQKPVLFRIDKFSSVVLYFDIRRLYYYSVAIRLFSQVDIRWQFYISIYVKLLTS